MILELTAPRRNSPFTRRIDLFAKVLLFLHIVMVAVDLVHIRGRSVFHAALERRQRVFHHRLAVQAGKLFAPSVPLRVIASKYSLPSLNTPDRGTAAFSAAPAFSCCAGPIKIGARWRCRCANGCSMIHTDRFHPGQTDLNKVVTGSQRSQVLIAVSTKARSSALTLISRFQLRPIPQANVGGFPMRPHRDARVR